MVRRIGAAVALLQLVVTAAHGLDNRTFFMEPPDCTYDILLDYGESIYLESSDRTHTENLPGRCSARLQNKNQSKHFYFQFEIGPNITDCSAELRLTNDGSASKRPQSLVYSCRNADAPLYHSAHADNWTVQVVVKREYTTLRKDFFFRLRVSQVEGWQQHGDNGLGYYYPKRIHDEPGIPYVLYTILALDFLIPTLIFIVNEFSGRMETSREEKAKLESSRVPVHKKALAGLEGQQILITDADDEPSRKSKDTLLFPYLLHTEASDKPTYLRRGTGYENSDRRPSERPSGNARTPILKLVNRTVTSPRKPSYSIKFMPTVSTDSD